MDADQIKTYLEILGCRGIRQRGGNVLSTCPNEHLHAKGRDRKPSFSVKIDSGSRSPSFCFACKTKDSFEWIVYERTGDKAVLQDGLHSIMPQKPNINAELWGEKKVEVEVVWPEELIKPFSGSVPKYAMKRGLTLSACRAWLLGYDRTAMRLTFPVRDISQKLWGVCGRTINNHTVKYANYLWHTKLDKLVPFRSNYDDSDLRPFEKSKHLFGEHMITYQTPIVVVEGQLDALLVWQLGYNAVSTMGSYISKEQVKRLIKLSRNHRQPLHILFDGDAAGDSGTEQLSGVLKDVVSYKILTCPREEDPGSLFEKDRPKLISLLDPAKKQI